MAKSRIKPADLLLKFLGLPLYPLSDITVVSFASLNPHLTVLYGVLVTADLEN